MATTTTATPGVKNAMIPTSSAWVPARIVAIVSETPTVKTFTFELPHPVTHLAGQHYEIRLTAPNGYQAARLYSAASAAANDNRLQLTIQLLEGGEVSPYMHHGTKVGDAIELRGPLGKFFVWDPAATAPVLLVAGGSGVVPMRCILQAHRSAKSATPLQLLYGARTYDDIIYKPELLNTPEVTIALSDSQPKGWPGLSGRINQAALQAVLAKLPALPICYLCGATPFVEAMATVIITAGVPAANIKAERFGS